MIGIDIISVSRFTKISEKDYGYWSKFFSKGEWQYAFSKSYPAGTLAGTLAAKEAIMKAKGGDLMGRTDRIVIDHLASGQPIALIDGKTQSTVKISISHQAETAVAVALVYES